VQPGATTTVEATGLEPNAMVKVVLGDLMLAAGQTDENGDVQVTFPVPSDTALGVRLMTVGVVGTILTADCTLEVVGGPVVCGDRIVGPGEGCDDGNTQGGDCCSALCQREREGRDVDQTCSNGKDDDCDGLVDNQDPDCNRPPDCSAAVATPAEIWPPRRRFVDVTIGGVTDPDGDTFTLTLTGITQDEPLFGRQGAGRRCPDGAGVGSPSGVLRAERIGRRDGRVYHVAFTAEDALGGRCNGLVTVCVPHDQRPGHVCIDEGPLFDSTGPCQ
jgi:cysteine-rich repeat protein